MDGFKTVPGMVLMVAGTWLVLEDLSLVQFELYRGGGEIPPPPRYNSNCTKESPPVQARCQRPLKTIKTVPGTVLNTPTPRTLKHQLSPCVDCQSVLARTPGSNFGKDDAQTGEVAVTFAAPKRQRW